MIPYPSCLGTMSATLERCILGKRIKEKFNECQNEDNLCKLGLLYFVHFVVLGNEDDSSIDYHRLESVDNEEK